MVTRQRTHRHEHSSVHLAASTEHLDRRRFRMGSLLRVGAVAAAQIRIEEEDEEYYRVCLLGIEEGADGGGEGRSTSALASDPSSASAPDLNNASTVDANAGTAACNSSVVSVGGEWNPIKIDEGDGDSTVASDGEDPALECKSTYRGLERGAQEVTLGEEQVARGSNAGHAAAGGVGAPTPRIKTDESERLQAFAGEDAFNGDAPSSLAGAGMVMKLTSEHAARTKFPPGCAVVYRVRRSASELSAGQGWGIRGDVLIRLGTVSSVSIDLAPNRRDLVYEIVSGAVAEEEGEKEATVVAVVGEQALAYAPLCPVVYTERNDGTTEAKKREGMVLLFEPASDPGPETAVIQPPSSCVYTIMVVVGDGDSDSVREIKRRVEPGSIEFRPPPSPSLHARALKILEKDEVATETSSLEDGTETKRIGDEEAGRISKKKKQKRPVSAMDGGSENTDEVEEVESEPRSSSNTWKCSASMSEGDESDDDGDNEAKAERLKKKHKKEKKKKSKKKNKKEAPAETSSLEDETETKRIGDEEVSGRISKKKKQKRPVSAMDSGSENTDEAEEAESEPRSSSNTRKCSASMSEGDESDDDGNNEAKAERLKKKHKKEKKEKRNKMKEKPKAENSKRSAESSYADLEQEVPAKKRMLDYSHVCSTLHASLVKDATLFQNVYIKIFPGTPVKRACWNVVRRQTSPYNVTASFYSPAVKDMGAVYQPMLQGGVLEGGKWWYRDEKGAKASAFLQFLTQAANKGLIKSSLDETIEGQPLFMNKREKTKGRHICKWY